MRLDIMIVAIVGMPGSGKSEVAKVFEESGFERIRFGDITDEEIRIRGLELNESNESYIRSLLRKEYGLEAYAKLSLPRITNALKSNSNVVIDGLYSWEEYCLLKEQYKEQLFIVAVWASPKVRYDRLARRTIRPLSYCEASSRDNDEILLINKGGPIAMADFTLRNDSSLSDLIVEVKNLVRYLDG